jgi:hypothetical protein
MEAMAAGMTIGNSQQTPAPNMDAIRRTVVGMRPLLHEVAREAVLAQCLFTHKDLSDAEIEEWLQFLRSDAAGDMPAATTTRCATPLLDVTEVFTRTLLQVARELKTQGVS